MRKISGKRRFLKMFPQPVQSGPTGAAASGQALSRSEGWPESPRYSPMSLLSDHDLYLFNEGSHVKLYERLGSHPMNLHGTDGTNFAVWAPDAKSVSVMGDFNGWNNASHYLSPRGASGIWEGFVPNVRPGESYKYHVVSRYQGYQVDKADPFA